MSFLIGVGGVVIGALTQFALARLGAFMDQRSQRKLDDARKALLLAALENPPAGSEWRQLSTLCGIVGAPPLETTRLLIEIGARGSENGNDVWALLSKKPL